jgi:hypothetical protein
MLAGPVGSTGAGVAVGSKDGTGVWVGTIVAAGDAVISGEIDGKGEGVGEEVGMLVGVG